MRKREYRQTYICEGKDSQTDKQINIDRQKIGICYES